MKTSTVLERTAAPVRARTKSPRQRLTKPDTALIVNPSSCSGVTGKDWDSLYPKIKAALGMNPKVVFTKKAGDGTVLSREFLRKGFMRIVALGGDGTLNEVANGFFEDPVGIHGSKDQKKSIFPSPSKLRPISPEATLAMVPCGTRNVLARSLGLPADVTECCLASSLGNTRRLDVITATVTGLVLE